MLSDFDILTQEKRRDFHSLTLPFKLKRDSMMTANRTSLSVPVGRTRTNSINSLSRIKSFKELYPAFAQNDVIFSMSYALFKKERLVIDNLLRRVSGLSPAVKKQTKKKKQSTYQFLFDVSFAVNLISPNFYLFRGAYFGDFLLHLLYDCPTY